MIPQPPTKSTLIACPDRENMPDHMIPQSARIIHGDTELFWVPLIVDKTVRGMRANDLICDYWPEMPKEVFDEVVKGFA
jgi:hypothetical protein